MAFNHYAADPVFSVMFQYYLLTDNFRVTLASPTFI